MRCASSKIASSSSAIHSSLVLWYSSQPTALGYDAAPPLPWISAIRFITPTIVVRKRRRDSPPAKACLKVT